MREIFTTSWRGYLKVGELVKWHWSILRRGNWWIGTEATNNTPISGDPSPCLGLLATSNASKGGSLTGMASFRDRILWTSPFNQFIFQFIASPLFGGWTKICELWTTSPPNKKKTYLGLFGNISQSYFYTYISRDRFSVCLEVSLKWGHQCCCQFF